MAKTLNIIETSNKELTIKWNVVPVSFRGRIFIRCNSKGIVNWDKAPVYSYDEIITRENINIIKT